MKKKLKTIAITIFTFAIFICCSNVVVATPTTTSEANIPSEAGTKTVNETPKEDQKRMEETNKKEEKKKKTTIKKKKNKNKKKNNIKKKKKNKNNNTKKKNQNKKFKKVVSKQYPTAAYIWNYLKKMGYNNYICAGIMGNLMIETGGRTLNLNPTIYGGGGSYYGICQWSAYYCPGVQGASLDGQLAYLAKTIKTEMNNYGFNYSSTMNYDNFLKMKNASNKWSSETINDILSNPFYAGNTVMNKYITNYMTKTCKKNKNKEALM